MCGISAIYRFNGLEKEDLGKLEAMNREMHYRGPDESGIWKDEYCGLAQTRLSIIGLDKGKQPLFNEDKSIILICNGEIYNYIELRQNLKQKGHSFQYDTDSETIIHLYEEHGTKCLAFLRGQFAFCLWDKQNQLLFSARDRIGEKTLYYSQVPCGVVLSTELKVILKNYIPNPQINYQQLAAPIRYTSPLDRKDTYIDQIKRVEAGQYVIVDSTGIRKYFYWKRKMSSRFHGTESQAKEETLSLLRESVNLHLRSDVPVAIMLSGGIDSSAIAALAKESGCEVHTITAGYKGLHDCDERDVAKRFASERGLIYHEVELDKQDFTNCFEEFTAHIDEPVTDSAALAQWALYRKVRSLGFKVLLGGMGGDELFYGYPYWNQFGEALALYRQHMSLHPWKSLKNKIKFIQFFIRYWKYVLKGGYPLKIRDSSIAAWHYEDYIKFAQTASIVWDGQDVPFEAIDLSYNMFDDHSRTAIDIAYDFQFEYIMSLVYLYLSDREGMGNSIEIRSPLLDYKLVEFVSSLPLSIKYQKDQPKYFMKIVLQGIVPDYILYAKKRGFTPPSEFVQNVVDSYNYRFFRAKHKFYNSILADRLLYLNLSRKS